MNAGEILTIRAPAASKTNHKATFFWGCLGAAMPPLLTAYKAVDAGRFVPHTAIYYPFVLVWVLVSGFVSIACRPDSEWQAMWVGASVPALIASMIAAPLVR